MIIEPETFSLDEFVKQHDGTEIELQIMKNYFELSPDMRATLVEHFRNAFANPVAVSSAPVAAQTINVEEAEESYKKAVLNSAKNTGYTASSTTEDMQGRKEA